MYNDDDLCLDWEDLPDDAKNALLKWYNIRTLEMERDDFQRLADLYNAGNFTYGECAECGAPYQHGRPDHWDHFQGVNEFHNFGDLCEDCYGKYMRLKEYADD